MMVILKIKMKNKRIKQYIFDNVEEARSYIEDLKEYINNEVKEIHIVKNGIEYDIKFVK